MSVSIRLFQGVILLFDFSRQVSLKHIKDWIDLIEMVGYIDIPVIFGI